MLLLVRMKKFLSFLLITVSSLQTYAELKLPAIIGDSMVLQQQTKAPIWGWANKGEKVTVKGSWPGATPATATAGNDGKWMTKIQTPIAGGPYNVTITGSEKITLKGVLIGEVWICSGQSNMEMPVEGWNGGSINNSKQEIANANYPAIRLFTVARNVSFAPQEDVKGSWAVCTPKTAATFSATAYFFGRELAQKLKVPIGLIHSSWGGTVAEAWTSNKVLRTLHDFDKELNKVDSVQQFSAAVANSDKENEATWQKALTDEHLDYTTATTNDADWKTMQMPNIWEGAGYPQLDGIVWLRKTVNLPADWAGKKLKLEFGPIDDYDATYLNGTHVGGFKQETAWMMNRNYEVPAGTTKIGENIIAIRITDLGGNGGMTGDKNAMKIYPADEPAKAITLSGDWKYKVESIKPVPVLAYNPNTPSVLYNSMIAPVIPFAVKGAIWYQGESNVGRNKQYASLFPAMIQDWRTRWQKGDFPFYFVQIAPFKYWGDSTQAAGLRDAQRYTLTASPNTGMAVTMDIGDVGNIHPSNKQDVGKRLSLWALAKTYHQKGIIYSGPLYKSMQVNGSQVTVTFTNTDKGLTTNGKQLSDFELAGADGIWHPAQAIIQGEKVVVESTAVSSPKNVRYAWYAAAEGTLFNGAGLPASSFSSELLK